ncbi:hypothetical protein RJ55_02826 [Drechmeria coniospora]|nr:hypothetical protein RJ55_02826 [Drechmeria coniospora]
MKFSHAAAILFAAVASAGVAGDRQPKLEPAEPAYDESSALDQSPRHLWSLPSLPFRGRVRRQSIDSVQAEAVSPCQLGESMSRTTRAPAIRRLSIRRRGRNGEPYTGAHAPLSASRGLGAAACVARCRLPSIGNVVSLPKSTPNASAVSSTPRPRINCDRLVRRSRSHSFDGEKRPVTGWRLFRPNLYVDAMNKNCFASLQALARAAKDSNAHVNSPSTEQIPGLCTGQLCNRSFLSLSKLRRISVTPCRHGRQAFAAASLPTQPRPRSTPSGSRTKRASQ